MKKLLITLSVLLLTSLGMRAQTSQYEPRESWPYLLEEFQQGQIKTGGGTVLNEGFYNICVTDGKLHFVNGGTIMVADMRQVATAQIGEGLYLAYMGKMFEAVVATPSCFLLKETTVDLDEYGKSEIGFGIRSTTASTQGIASVNLGDGAINQSLDTALARAKSGAALPLKENWWFLVGGRLYDASKRTFLQMEDIDANDAKAFLKKERIKWHDAESLGKVLNYIAEHREK